MHIYCNGLKVIHTPAFKRGLIFREIFFAARNFDIRSAVRMLYRNLKWRKENQLDHILEEDWDNFEKEYQYEVQGCDKGGRPGMQRN